MSLENLKKKLEKKITDKAMGEIVTLLISKLDELIAVEKENREILKHISRKLGGSSER